LLERSVPHKASISSDLVDDRHASSRLAYDRDLRAITTKQMNVLVDPFQSEPLVMQA
jgi:hypothetical protein